MNKKSYIVIGDFKYKGNGSSYRDVKVFSSSVEAYNYAQQFVGAKIYKSVEVKLIANITEKIA